MTFQHISASASQNPQATQENALLRSRLIRGQAEQPSTEIPENEHLSRLHADFTRIPVHRPDGSLLHPQLIQPKLTIAQPGDSYEQEADRMAHQVVQRIHSSPSTGFTRVQEPSKSPEVGTIQREAMSDEDEDEKIQMKPMQSLVQRQADSNGMAASPELQSSIQQAQGSGQPLADSIRAPMERSFGTDFSRVRVHTDDRSDHLNRSISAKAFTTGHDIFFRRGGYDPGSRSGQELIAHELTHVVQQQSNGSPYQSPIIQCKNDKFTMKFDLGRVTGEVATLGTALEKIYNDHKRQKKDSRKKLDDDYQTAIVGLADKQEYLKQKVHRKVITDLNSSATQLLPVPDDVTPDLASKLSDETRQKLDQDTTTLASSIVPEMQTEKVRLGTKVTTQQAAIRSSIDGKIAQLVGGHPHATFLKDRIKRQLQERVQGSQYGDLNLAVPATKVDDPYLSLKRDLGTLKGAVSRLLPKKPKASTPSVATTPPISAEAIEGLVDEKFPGSPNRGYLIAKLKSEYLSEAMSLLDPVQVLETLISTYVEKIMQSLAEQLQQLAETVSNANSLSLNEGNIKNYVSARTKHHLADPIVEHYEKGYLDSGMDREKLLTEMRRTAKEQGYLLNEYVTGTSTELRLQKRRVKSAPEYLIAHLYDKHERFVRKPDLVIGSPGRARSRSIYEHRTTGIEYIRDSAGVFLRRHQTRYLNEYDKPEHSSILADPRIGVGKTKPWKKIAEEDVPTMSATERDREIWKHQRRKEAQGGSPFISMTSTAHPIFGSTGQDFRSEHGSATIDLGMVPKEQVIDTHSSEAISRITGISAPDPSRGFRLDDLEAEKNLAARDAMRTREIVVAGDIPEDAIREYTRGGKKYRKNSSGIFEEVTS